MTRNIRLDGTPKASGRLKTCSKCHQEREPDGGAEMGPERWYCAECWRLFNSRRFK
jgi:hypothetical protein